MKLNSGKISCACEQDKGGIKNLKIAELKKIISSENLKYVNQRKWEFYEIWVPFNGVQIDLALTRIKKKDIEETILVRHLYPDNIYISVEVVKYRNKKK